MKKIETIIQPENLVVISNALVSSGVMDMTVSQVRKFTQHNGQIQRYRGLKFRVNFLTEIKLEVVVDDSQVNLVLEKIVTAVPNGGIDRSKILIIPIEEASSSQVFAQTLAMAQ